MPKRDPAAVAWHWAESDHWEVAFHGLPRRFPWRDMDKEPPAASYPNVPGGFPILPLFAAVEGMLAQTAARPDAAEAARDPRFRAFAWHIAHGNEFGEAMEQGDLLAAEAALNHLAGDWPEPAFLLFNRAFVCKRTGREAEARELYRRAAILCPESEMLWRQYADASEAAGDRAEAIRANHEARRILPNHQQATLALERLGELVRVTHRDDPDTPRFLPKEEIRAGLEGNLTECWEDSDRLRSFAGQVLQDGLFPDLGRRALERSLELEPDDPEALRNLGVALRIEGRPRESLLPLLRSGSLEVSAWTFFHLAETYLDLPGENDAVWDMLNEALDCDPNHEPALKLRFLGRNDRSPEEKETDLADYGRPRPAEGWAGSWQALLVAAEQAWKRGAQEAAVRHAAEAYRFAPDAGDVFLTYTGMLAASGEHEWVAALTKPRLRAGEASPRAFMNFARALDAMDLRTEAVATVRRALAELTLDREERHAFTGQLDEWTGRFAIGEVPAELHAGVPALRRGVFMVREGKVELELFEAGLGLPHHRTLPVTFKKPKDEFDVTLEQRFELTDPAALPLGTWTVREVDPALRETEPVTLELALDEEGKISLGARQGAERKLGVTWGLYPPPRHESAEPDA